MCTNFLFALLLRSAFENFKNISKILWVYLLQTLTRSHSSTWVTKGFKGFVAYAKCNRDSYESESGLSSFVFVFVLLEDEKKIGVGVFFGPICYAILYFYLLSLARIIM